FESEIILRRRVGQADARLFGIVHHVGDGRLELVLERGALDVGKRGDRDEESPALLEKGGQLFLFLSGFLDVLLVRVRVAIDQILQLLRLRSQLAAHFIDRLFSGEEKKEGKSKQAEG